MKKPSLDKSALYKRFIDERDKALEVYLSRYKQANAAIVKKLTEQTIDHSLAIQAQSTITKINHRFIQQKLEPTFMQAMLATYQVYRRMIKNASLLAYWGEAEAIGQALGRKTKISRQSFELSDKTLRKIEYHYNQLLRKIIGAVELSLLLEETPEDLIDRIKKKMPKLSPQPQIGRELRSLYREASDNKPKIDFVDGLIDEQDWEDMFQDYVKNEPWYTTYTRSEREMPNEQAEWELERDATTDFVYNVRMGQNTAANENGIIDMMWISVSHKTLCESCEWRDGLTSTEIEAKLSEMDDHIDAITPPAHPHCYCRLAPVTQELIDATPDQSIAKDFDEWLRS